MSNQNVLIHWEYIGAETRSEAFNIVATPIDGSPRDESVWEFDSEEAAEDFVIQFRQTPGVTVVEELRGRRP